MQRSFFDYALEYQEGKRSTQFLSEMKILIPFDAIGTETHYLGLHKTLSTLI